MRFSKQESPKEVAYDLNCYLRKDLNNLTHEQDLSVDEFCVI